MIQGKTIFTWNVPAIEDGDPVRFTKKLVEGGFEGVCLKVANGNTVFKMHLDSPWPTWGENVKLELVKALKAAGLKVYFWHFLYGGDINGELAIADKQCDKFAPDGYIWDAETAFDGKVSSDGNARIISKGLKLYHPEIPQALCWWALPLSPLSRTEWHPIRVAKAFMENVNCVMPMMYWDGKTAAQATSYLDKSLSIWRSFCRLPIIPVGRAYVGDGGLLDADAIKAFALKVMELSKDNNLSGISWWSFEHVIKDLACWNALKSTPKFSNPKPPTPLSTDEILKRLVNDHKYLFPELFK